MFQERWEVTIPTNFKSELVREVVADAPEFLGIGVETATGLAMGGGAVALAVGGYKLLRWFGDKRREKKGEASGDVPFPRRLAEARQQRQLRQHVETRCPEFDAAVGRIFDDEYKLSQQTGGEEENRVLGRFYERIRGRVDKLMPPSIREYIGEK